MKPVLLIAYFFPPETDAGVHRSIRFAKLLPEFGYQPIVLTVDADELKARGARIDQDLLKQLPENLEIIRVPSQFDFARQNRLMQKRIFRFTWYFQYSKWRESAEGWIKNAYHFAKKAIEKHKIKIVYTSVAPLASMDLALRLKRELGVKWVADMRDPFTDAYAYRFPSKRHWLQQRQWEAATFPQADKLIVNTPEVKRLYLKRGLVPENKITVLTNGYLNG